MSSSKRTMTEGQGQPHATAAGGKAAKDTSRSKGAATTETGHHGSVRGHKRMEAGKGQASGAPGTSGSAGDHGRDQPPQPAYYKPSRERHATTTTTGHGAEHSATASPTTMLCRHLREMKEAGITGSGSAALLPLAEVMHQASVRDALAVRDGNYAPREDTSSSSSSSATAAGDALSSAWHAVASTAGSEAAIGGTSDSRASTGDMTFAAPKHLVCVYAEDPINAAMDKLRGAKILGAPVVSGDRIVGSIDMLDIANFVLSTTVVDSSRVEHMDVKQLKLMAHKMAEAPVSEAMGIGGETAMAVSENDILAHEAHVFIKQRVHRVAVYDPTTKQVKGILTQTDLVRFITQQLETNPKLKDTANIKMNQLGYTGKGFKVVKIAGNASVLQAVERLAATRVSGLAVVNPTSGRLIGNFSASDLKGLFADQFPLLAKPVTDFLDDHSPQSMKPIIEPGDTRSLLDVCKSMLMNRVHRVWMVDADYRPINVVTMSDIIRIAAGPLD